MNVQATLNEVFRQVFDDEEISINPDTTANDIDGWDSLSHVNLIVAVESRFGVRFSQRELLTFRNVGDLIDSIKAKL
ncbi:acyl carrier protein [Geomonas nitrogeniifigens]|uniref:Acyl carrier protein n=1 Tax=Geomonas diazotrophica TaxID=2843197 RepID=A0ABX8JEC5_9BACT|nr:acyl carrier protein [Geomonas nitrogeniifigens]QWV95954.1 acyl carrier protein [Geomonas nitrogeniifigens]